MSESVTTQTHPLPAGLALYNHPIHGLVVTSDNPSGKLTSALATWSTSAHGQFLITPDELASWQGYKVHGATSADLPAGFMLVAHPVYGAMVARSPRNGSPAFSFDAIYIESRFSKVALDAHITVVHRAALRTTNGHKPVNATTAASPFSLYDLLKDFINAPQDFTWMIAQYNDKHYIIHSINQENQICTLLARDGSGLSTASTTDVFPYLHVQPNIDLDPHPVKRTLVLPQD